MFGIFTIYSPFKDVKIYINRLIHFKYSIKQKTQNYIIVPICNNFA